MAVAPGRVDPAVERDLAEALGATSETAAAAVAALTAAGVLSHGVVVIAAVVAARAGVELPAALERLAVDGAPRGISDYELRTAAEEGEADLDDAWRAAVREGRADTGVWQRLLAPGPSTTSTHSEDELESGRVDSHPVRSSFHIHPERLDTT